MLTASSISSMDISITITFFRFRKIPKMPVTNMIAETKR